MKRYLVSVILAFIATCGIHNAYAETTTADSWEHLPDGRVVIDIKGRKYAFYYDPNDPEPANAIQFQIGTEANKILSRDVPDGITLNKVVQNPALAKRAFAIAGARVDVLPLRARLKPSGQPYLDEGKFDPSKLAHDALGGDYTFYPEGNPGIPLECAPPGTPRDSNGFSVSSKGLHCLPAKKRHFTTPNDLKIECVLLCQAWFHSAKGDLMVSYAFDANKFPESEWANLDKNMRDYFNYILMSEEMQ